MTTGLNRALAHRLSPQARQRVRRATDRLTTGVGSLKGCRTDTPVVALTYDDGPDPEGTPAVLAALAEAGVTATFFQLVERAEQYPELVRAVLAAGHEIGLHGIDHARLTTRPIRQASGWLVEGRARLSAVAGRPIRLFRPTYGAQSLRTYLAARQAGLLPVVWGPSADDWRDGDPAEVANRVTTRLGPGEVVLLHDGFEVPPGDHTPRPAFDRGAVTSALLDLLAERDYTATSVSGLLRHGAPWRTAWFRP
ncbi:MAG: polysaccharide deacetylase family protein [Actinobacteria bacterium]|nr:polysaccharide deacetylase family protein [Actinomycetota bacterium]MBI3686611.1 polysaccharide deacetylase family protein [Actinomycetota bacterium]